MIGTIVNTATVIVGSLVGVFLHSRFPERLTKIIFQAIGLFTLFLGFAMALKTQKMLILIFSIVGGALIGELIDIDRHLSRFGEWLKAKLRISGKHFTEGLVTAFLVFCMGSMTVLGAVEEGLGKTPNLYFAKSLLDGFASVALAAGLGLGVLFSAIPLFIYQAGLTLLVRLLNTLLTERIAAEMTAVGGLILIGLGINLLEIKRLKVLNMLPALLVAILLTLIFS
ncbi:MAG: DUF554 domain-containing protein [candidate division WOR-3 bacterium]